jgi:hypothetical protein
MKKRILALLTVAALMVVTLAMALAPAFADPAPNHPPVYFCTNTADPGDRLLVTPKTDPSKQDLMKSGWECVRLPKKVK